VNTFRTDFTQNSGILRGNTDQGFFFLHLTVHEFLAAAAMAHIINERGWDAVIEPAEGQVDLQRLIDGKAWDPRWQEVMTFLAGQLADPLPLLTLLTQEKRDDVFRHRLALAAHCLPELRLSPTKNLTGMVNQVTTAAFSFWSGHEGRGTDATVPHFTRALPALGQVNGCVEKTTLLQRLARELQEEKEDARIGAMRAVGIMGISAIQHPEVLAALIAALRAPDEMVRAEAALALRRIGKTTLLAPEAARALTQATQQDPSWFVRSTAAQALQHLRQTGAAAAETAGNRASTVNEEDDGLLPVARQFSDGGTGEEVPVVTPARLMTLLFSEDPTARARAAHALGQQKGRSVEQRELIPALVQIALHDKDRGVRGQALDALAQIGAEAGNDARDQAFLALIHALQRDKEGSIRAHAARALRVLVGKEVPGAEACSALLAALADPDVNVRAEAAAVLGETMAQGARLFRRWWRKIEVKSVEELSEVSE